MKKITQPATWFASGIPNANLVAPWQSPNLNTNTMYPDETGTIQYILNSKGYRDVEWQGMDGVWCIGHSDVFGIGVDVEQTWPRLIGGMNLGIAGASWDTISRTICSGLSMHTPSCIIIQSTTKERKEFISNSKCQVVLPNMPTELLPHKEIWKYSDDTSEQYSYEKNLALIILACRANNIKLIMFELEDRWESIRQDPAVDNQHIGPATHSKIAEYLKQQLSNNEK